MPKTYIPDDSPATEVDDDIFTESQPIDFSHEVSAFKAHLRRVKKVVGANTEFWGGVERQQDVFRFIKRSRRRIQTSWL